MSEYPKQARMSIRMAVAVTLMYSYAGIARCASSRQPAIIPLPVTCEQRDGLFAVTPSTRVIAED